MGEGSILEEEVHKKEREKEEEDVEIGLEQ